jgi:thiol-disulfide isomerase/thioredoxin
VRMMLAPRSSTTTFALALALATFSFGSSACRPDTDSTGVPASANTTVVSLTGMDCESCGATVIEKLLQQPGVYAATFDRVLGEVTVQYDATQVDVPSLLAIVTSLGYGAIEGAGHGEYLPEVAFTDGLDVVTISIRGEAVDLESHLVPGKVTVIDFYAVWCKPCRKVDEHMITVLAAHDDVALRKVDIVDWDSEVAQQHMKSVPNLPYLIVYGRDGKQLATISGLDLEKLDAAIAEARGR